MEEEDGEENPGGKSRRHKSRDPLSLMVLTTLKCSWLTLLCTEPTTYHGVNQCESLLHAAKIKLGFIDSTCIVPWKTMQVL